MDFDIAVFDLQIENLCLDLLVFDVLGFDFVIFRSSWLRRFVFNIVVSTTRNVSIFFLINVASILKETDIVYFFLNISLVPENKSIKIYKIKKKTVKQIIDCLQFKRV